MKILIADDSQFMRNVLIDIVKNSGHEYVTAQNGEEVIEKALSEKPDLILLDIIMPEVDGLAVLKQIGKEHKIIVISAVGQEEMINEAKTLGALDFIVKPFEEDKVIEAIKNATS